MYLHLGQNTIVRTEQILGVFDMDNSTVSKHTRQFLTKAQRENRVINVSMELPKSFVVCGEGEKQRIYLSQIAPATLLRRAQAGFFLEEPPQKKRKETEKL